MYRQMVLTRLFKDITKVLKPELIRRTILTSQIPDLELFHGSLHDRVFKDIHKYADRIALVDSIKGTQYTYSETFQLVKNVSSGLAKVKVGKGTVVGIILPNLPEYLFSIYGVLATGATVTFFNRSLKTSEMVILMKKSKADFLITYPDVLDTVLNAAKQINTIKDIYVVGEAASGTKSFYQELLEDDGRACPYGQVDIDPVNDVAMMPFSSGTTGFPKCTMVTHQNMTANIDQVSCVRKNLPDGDNILLSLPVFHMFSISISNFGLSCGSKLVTLPQFEPRKYLESLSKYKISYLYVVPPHLLFLINQANLEEYNLSSIQQVMCSAAPLAYNVQDAFLKKMKPVSPNIDVFQGYGMTEIAIGFHLPPKEKRPPSKQITNSVGILLPNMQSKIISEDNKELGPDELGEIIVKGPNVMKGYLNDSEATENCLKDGWLHTGDIGKYDKDGYFYVVDRLKELIKYEGMQVAPADLEAVLQTHPAVSHAAVIGKPDEKAGELPTAFVVKREEVTEKELQDFVAEKCADFKRLRGGVNFVDQIPVSPSGKILRKELRNILKSGQK